MCRENRVKQSRGVNGMGWEYFKCFRQIRMNKDLGIEERIKKVTAESDVIAAKA